MRVKVNRRYIDLFEGAQVKHALLKYFIARKLDRSLMNTVMVRDAYGHLIDQDAPLKENQKIIFKVPKI
ncbi:MAG: hypothetical protein IKH99_05325 [Prevotella sp.]|jgi:hypothetical protein|nr:hypothetical protein [Prevotella sp.]